MPVKVSIILCTRNRAPNLKQTLEAFAKVSVPDEITADLWVVDNGSTDDTASVIAASRLPNLPVRGVCETQPGLSAARNRGIAETKGDIILFTDDDVRPMPDWIAGMCRPILSGEAHAVAGSVRLAPYLERSWMTPTHRNWLAEATPPQNTHKADMVGANMAFAREVLNKVPRFDTELGAGALGFGEEVLFCWQLIEAWYVSVGAAEDVFVEHHFEEHRLLRSSFLSSAKKRGASEAYLNYHWQHGEISSCALRLRVAKAKLALWRAQNRQACQAEEGIAEAEMRRLKYIAHLESFLQERCRPHKYARYGLEKLVKV